MRPSLGQLVKQSLICLLAAGGLALAGCEDKVDIPIPHHLSLLLTPAHATVDQGSTLTVQTSAFGSLDVAGPLTYTATGAPAGVVVTLEHGVPLGGFENGTMVLAVGTETAPGTYNIVLAITGGGLKTNANFALTVTAKKDFTLAASPSAVTLPAGGNGSSAISVARLNGFDGPILFSATGLPNGLTVAFDPNNILGNNSSATFAATTATAPGTYDVTITGTSGLTIHTVHVSVTITPFLDFNVTVLPVSFSIVQGGGATGIVTINRLGAFTGPVTLSATGLPPGVTATFLPLTVSGNTATITLSASSGALAGSSIFSIIGTSGTMIRPLAVPISVVAGAPVFFEFIACQGTILFKAFQDGTSPPVLLDANNSATISTTSTSGAVNYVTLQNGAFNTFVEYYSRAELVNGPVQVCPTFITGTKTVTATAAGVGSSEAGLVNFGATYDLASQFHLNLQLTAVREGTHDIVGYKGALLDFATGARGFLLRNQTVANNGNLGLVDFNGANSFAPLAPVITVPNVLAGETLFSNMNYMTGASCVPSRLWNWSGMTSPFPVPTFPASVQVASDMHQLSIEGHNSVGQRAITEAFHTSGPRTISLPEVLSGVVVTAASGVPYKSLQATLNATPTIPNGDAQIVYFDGNFSHITTVTATAGFLAGRSTYPLVMTNLRALPGWLDSWMPTGTVNWQVSVSTTGTTSPCTDGQTYKTSRFSGSN